jgi:hypothetical protein
MGMPPATKAEDFKTREILEEGISPTFPLAHVEHSSFPAQSEITYIGRHHLGKLVNGLVPTQGRFN